MRLYVLLLLLSIFNANYCQSDSLKNALLQNRLKDAYGYILTDSEKTKSIAESVLTEAKEDGNLLRIADGFNAIGMSFYYGGDYLTAVSYFDSAYNVVVAIPDTMRMARTLNRLGVTYLGGGDYQNALKAYEKSLFLAEQINDYGQIIASYNNLGVVYLQTGNTEKSVEYYYKSLSFAENHNDTAGMATAYANLGIVYKDNHRYKLAIEFLEKAIEVFVKLGIEDKEGDAYTNLAEVYFAMENDTIGILYLHKAIQLHVKNNNQRGLGYAHVSLGKRYLVNEMIDSATHYLERSLLIGNLLGDVTIQSQANNAIGMLYYSQRKIQEAITYLEKGFDASTSMGYLEGVLESSEYLSYAYSDRYNFEKAYFYSSQHANVLDSISKMNQLKEIENLRFTFELDKQKQETELHKNKVLLSQEHLASVIKDKELSRYRFIAIILITAIVLMVVVILYMGQRKKKALLEVQQRLTEKDLKTSLVENRKLLDEVDYKSKEFQNLANHIVKKNEIIEQIKLELTEIESPVAGKISLLMQSAFDLDNHKLEFERHIEQIHSLFYKELQDCHPDLTKNEIRLCGLLRLEMSSKEISSLLNISPKSVDMSRYRLRKKLNLSTNAPIHEYFQGIGKQ